MMTSGRLLDPTNCCPVPEGKSSKYGPTNDDARSDWEETARMATCFVACREGRESGKGSVDGSWRPSQHGLGVS